MPNDSQWERCSAGGALGPRPDFPGSGVFLPSAWERSRVCVGVCGCVALVCQDVVGGAFGGKAGKSGQD